MPGAGSTAPTAVAGIVWNKQKLNIHGTNPSNGSPWATDLQLSYDTARASGVGSGDDLRHAFSLLARIADHRSVRSCAVVSSSRVAMVHTCPEGSMIQAMRSPQNWSCRG